MARIRSLKPEFQLSQAMSRVSRDARLLFLLVQPQCDDHGKFRGASRMLASLLFPYDDDVPNLIEGWLVELEQEGCVTRYIVDGNEYLRIENWEEYQKVDKPSASRFPDPPETSRALASPRERSALDQGSRIKEGIEEGRGRAHARARGSASNDDGTMHPLPEGWSPSAADEVWTREHRADLEPSVVARQLERFRQHNNAVNRRVANWSAKWRMWIIDTHARAADGGASARGEAASSVGPLPGPDGPARLWLSNYKPDDEWDEVKRGSRPESDQNNPNIPTVMRRAWRQRFGYPPDWRPEGARAA